MSSTPWRLLAGTILMLGLPWPATNSALAQQSGLWDRVRQGGYVLRIRDTGMPVAVPAGSSGGGGCTPDRNLTGTGRDLAQRLGEVFREHGILVSRVLSSPGCSSVETAQIAFGRTETWTQADPEGDPRIWRARNAYALTSLTPADANLVIVTGKLVISDLTDNSVSAGDVLVLRPSGEQLDVQGLLSAAP